jgi:protein SCO1/2
MSSAEHSATERLIWGVLVAGLLGIGILAAASYLKPAASQPDRLGEAPAFTLTTQNETVFSHTQLSGKVWMTDFMFTQCRGICLVLTQRMKKLQDDLIDQPGWEMVSITVDPEHDTPRVLADYAREHDCDPERWVFLTGEKEAVRKLSIEGFHLAVEDVGESEEEPILHSQRIILVDAENEIRGFYDALDEEAMKQLASHVRLLLEASS